LATDAAFSRNGDFHLIPWVDTEKMMHLFRHSVFQALLAEEKINPGIVDLLLSWQQPGFSVFRGEPVEPNDTAPRERLVRYLLHPAFATEMLHYDSTTATVTYNPAKKAHPCRFSSFSHGNCGNSGQPLASCAGSFKASSYIREEVLDFLEGRNA
jgi:hypothetical protein